MTKYIFKIKDGFIITKNEKTGYWQKQELIV